MQDLTDREYRDLTEINQDTKKMDFAGKIQELIDSVPENGTPVNGVQADISLAVSGVVIDGESVTIDNPLVALEDVYEFNAAIVQVPSDPAYIPVDIEPDTAHAVGTLTMDTQPIAGDTFTLGATVYTFVTDGTANSAGEVSIGADLAEAKLNLVAAVNGTDGHNAADARVSAGAFAVDDCVITELIGGITGNTRATTETFTAVTNIFSAVTLLGGTDCIAADAITALAAAMVASDTQGVVGVDGAGDTLDIDADVAGVVGNDIIIAEDMANGAFAGAAVLLAGGIDGTVGLVGTPKIDATYLYWCIADNTIAGANWRRIAVGSVF